MAITVVSEPGYLSLSKDPIEFHLQTNKWVTTQPTTSIYSMVFSTKLTTAGEKLTFDWNGNTVTFVVEATTDPDGYNLPTALGSTTLEEYVEALVDNWFGGNYLLLRDFEITKSGTDTIIFAGRDSSIDMNAPVTDINASYATLTGVSSGVEAVYNPNFTFIMHVEVEEVYGSDEWTRLDPIHAYPILYYDTIALNWKGRAKIDVSTLIDGMLQTREETLDIDETDEVIADQTNLQWRVIYTEQYTIDSSLFTDLHEDVFQGPTYVSDTKRVIKGGMKYLDIPLFPDLITDFYGTATKPANTWVPNGAFVTQEQLHFLTYLITHVQTGVATFDLKATVYYTDSTDDTDVILSTTDPLENETWRFPVGFLANGLEAWQPAKIPYKYEIWLQYSDLGDPWVGERKTFWLEVESRQDRYFIYENSFGAHEILRTSGEFSATPEVSKTTGKRVVEAGYAADNANFAQKSNGYSDVFEVSTGFKTKEEFIQLREFINSDIHYEIIDGKKVPIVVSTTKMKLEYELTGSYDRIESFKYRHAFINKAYSNA